MGNNGNESSGGTPIGSNAEENALGLTREEQIRNNTIDAMNDMFFENEDEPREWYDDFVQAFNESYGDMSVGYSGDDSFLEEMQGDLEKALKNVVGEDIPVYVGEKSRQQILDELEEGQTAVELYPEGPDYVDYDVITKGFD